jgi:casein kinase I homolog HRR25
MLIDNRYQIEAEINRGAFGIIYRGTDLRSNRTDLRSNRKPEEKVAIKFELPHSLSSLKYEVKILTYLKTNKIKKVPDVFWYGIYNRVPCLVMTYYESSLYDYCTRFPERIDTRKINNWIFQLVEIIENFHKVYLLHRDIKPQNIMMKGECIYLIDFGLSAFYLDENREHIADYSEVSEEEENRIIGSLKFASIFLHEGHRYSRRDDFISIVYLFGYLLIGGETPWLSPDPKITAQNKRKGPFMTIIESNVRECENLTIFRYFCDYCYQLSYEETPDYLSIKRLFSTDR